MYVVPSMSVKTMPASEADAELAAAFIFGGRVLGRPEAAEWGRRRRPEEEDSPAVWLEVIVYLSMLGIYYLSTLSGDGDHAAGTGGSALALLPTCRPIAHGPPACYDWERSPDMMALPGSGLGYSDWSGDDGHPKTPIECFYDLVYDATRTCDEWERPAMVLPGNGFGDSYWSGNDDEKATMECFYGLVRDAAKICFGWSYDSVHPDDDSYDDPPPT